MSPSVAGKAPTIYDVAELAGVSHQTVSRFVKGQTNIRPQTRERVEAAVRELGYKPNNAARALATSHRNRIGALVYELMEVGPNQIVQGASVRARQAGYLLDIVSLDPNDDAAIEQAIELISQQDLAGLMVFALTDRVINAVRRVRFTVPVHIESDVLPLASVEEAANEAGVRLLMEHLLDLGHRRFYQIAGPSDWPSARARSQAYEKALRFPGASSAGTLHGDWTAASGYRAGSKIPLGEGISAVVAGNDQMALGVMAALHERGVRVPEDMSVVGFDGIPEAAYFRPPLTTVRLDLEGIGARAFDQLLEKITTTEPVASRRVADPILVTAGSSSRHR